MGVSRIYKVGSPYNGDELFEVDYEQTADTMYFAHINQEPYKLIRNAHDDWEFISVTFGPSVSAPASVSASATTPNTDSENSGAAYFAQTDKYIVTAFDDDTGQESRGSSSASATNDLTLKRNYNTISWGSVAGAERYNVYKSHNSEYYGLIGTTESTTFRDDNIEPALDVTPPEGFNPFGGAGDYPSTVTLFEQRIFYARSSNGPNVIWASRTGELENFDKSTPLQADDSVVFSIFAGRVNSVNQLASTTSLLALTSDSIFNVDGDGGGGAITATSVAVRRQVGRGSSRLRPLVIDNVVFYIPSTGDSVRTVNYSFEYDGLKSDDVSIFSPHLFESKPIVSWCYSQEPRSLIWACNTEGELLCFTWEQEQNIWGWTNCPTDGLVKCVASITENGEDRVYLIVERSVDGVARTFVERMVSHKWENLEDTCFMDCAVTGEFDPPQSTFSGLWHLEGRQNVVGICDGVVAEGLSVSDGTVTLPANIGTASKVSFGIPYEVNIKTLPVRQNSQNDGVNVGRRQQTGQIAITLDRTSSVLAGVNEDKLYLVKNRTSEPYGAPDKLMTGSYQISTANHVSGEAEAHIRQTAPLPLTVLGIFLEPVIND